MKNTGHALGELKSLVQDRDCWRTFVGGLRFRRGGRR